MADDWPRLTTKLRSYVIARDRAKGMTLLGGLGALGVGQMWFEDSDHFAEKPDWADAPEQESPPRLSGKPWSEDDLRAELQDWIDNAEREPVLSALRHNFWADLYVSAYGGKLDD